MNYPQKIAVIGGGSWATAIVKMLCENVDSLGWWMRNEEAITHIQKYGHNPNYISAAELKKEKLNISSDLNAIVSGEGNLTLFNNSDIFLSLSNLLKFVCNLKASSI